VTTASALPRLFNCPSSAVLPRAENASEWASAGNDDHEQLMRDLLAGDLPPWIAAIVPPNSKPEVALAFDVATKQGRIVGENLGRAYGTIGVFEIVGSCDVLGIEAGRAVVIDYKTGHNPVEPAATNGQLWFYALAAARALGLSSAVVRIVYTQSRRIDEYEIDALELADFASRLERLHVNVAALQERHKKGEILETREGTWCRYCASKPYCPSKNALLVQVAEHGLAVVGDTAITPARAATAYEQIVREARKRLETYVDEQGPIDLGGGRMFGRYVRNGNERLSGDVAVTAIAEVIGESAREFEAVAIERKTTKAAIERAAKAVGAKRGTAAAVVKKIRELGGATHGADSMPIGEYTRGKDEPSELPALDVAAVNAALATA
jgi:CRISPR/Cas system-associated exonuclease Cas4 (RecB family)